MTARLVRALGIVAVLVGIAAGCHDQTAPARAQWTVFLATDAPVPSFGDQVSVELFSDDGTSMGSPRVLDGSRSSVWPISFGIIPSTDSPPRVRVRLYRTDQTAADGTPDPATVIDATATLPPADGVTRVSVTLAMACFGIAADVVAHSTCDPTMGILAPEPTLTPMTSTTNLPTPGSWPPAAVVPCASPPPDGMICIPGGAFLLGTTQYIPTEADSDPYPPHLVQLSPFAIDVDEFSVAKIRDLVTNHGLTPPATQGVGPAEQQECTYLGANDGANDAYPANCLSWMTASSACALVGKRLPTEAEWEYTAGNLGAKTQFTWGSDPAICSHAVVARGLETDPTQCLGGGQIAPGPAPEESEPDVTSLGVHDLAGGVAEWLVDEFDAFSAPCWTSGGALLVDPTCMTSSTANPSHSARGGAWNLSQFTADVSFRLSTGSDGPEANVGFRCAVSM